MEGFGIPVLDAACLGLPALASPIGSHREIQAMHDFQEHVLLCSTLHTSDWASAMRLVVLRLQQKRQDLSPEGEHLLLNKIRLERIQRYLALQEQIKTALGLASASCSAKTQVSTGSAQPCQSPDLGANRIHLTLHAERSRQL